MSDPVRDAVYSMIDGLTEERIRDMFLKGDGGSVIRDIVSGCASVTLGDHARMAGVATVLLHYLLTLLLIPSQRKTVLDGISVDIAIPDTVTLQTNWNSALVLCILESIDARYVESRICDARKIQPNLQNIWLVSPAPVCAPYNVFVIDAAESFSGIIQHINEFLAKNDASRFRIFKAV